MSPGGVGWDWGLQSEVQCITGNGHMGTPFPLNRMTDTCKNITFQQLPWRAVNISFIHLTPRKRTMHSSRVCSMMMIVIRTYWSLVVLTVDLVSIDIRKSTVWCDGMDCSSICVVVNFRWSKWTSVYIWQVSLKVFHKPCNCGYIHAYTRLQMECTIFIILILVCLKWNGKQLVNITCKCTTFWLLFSSIQVILCGSSGGAVTRVSRNDPHQTLHTNACASLHGQ